MIWEAEAAPGAAIEWPIDIPAIYCIAVVSFGRAAATDFFLWLFGMLSGGHMPPASQTTRFRR